LRDRDAMMLLVWMYVAGLVALMAVDIVQSLGG
jgi:hypothetical protein